MSDCRLISPCYMYYTGQDGSDAHGPNCHRCMNDLFREGKLYDIQMVFINTPSGLVPVTPRFLVFTYGVTSPFSLTSFAEDFLVTRCVQCAEKAIRLQMSDAARVDNPDTVANAQQVIKTECVHEAVPVMCPTLATEPLMNTLTHTDSSTEFSSGQPGNHMGLESSTEYQRKSFEERTPSFLSGTSPPRRFYCRSPCPKERSRSQDRKRSEIGECSPEPRSRKHRDRSRSCDRKKDRERDGKKRKHSRSLTRNRKKDRRSRSPKRRNTFSDNDEELPFLYGRSTEEVNDPISTEGKSPDDWISTMAKANLRKSEMVRYVTKLGRSYFVNQDVIACNYCNMLFSNVHGTSLIYHLLGSQHWKNVKQAGLVFSQSRDFVKLADYATRTAVPVKSARIPFVCESRNIGNGMCLERLANYFNCLMRMRLINEDFSDYLCHVYPKLKDIDTCFLCQLPVPPGQSADGYLKHFLSSTHIAKVKENNWNLGSDFGRFVSHLYTFLNRKGRREEANAILSKLQLAGKLEEHTSIKNTPHLQGEGW